MYEAGAPIFVPGYPTGLSRPPSAERLPLVWTGSEYITALFAFDDSDGVEGSILLKRFSEGGTPSGPDWVYDIKGVSFSNELAWTGSQLGLFFIDRYSGLYYQALTDTGEPIGLPKLVEPDPEAWGPSADNQSGGFVLAWGAGDSIRVRLVDIDGTITGPPVEVESNACGFPDVAAGTSSIGVSMCVDGIDARAPISYRFVRLNSDLTSITYSGILSDGGVGDVDWADDRFIVAWQHTDHMETEYVEECVARFTPEGDLEGPPVCTDVYSLTDYISPTRMAAGDGGLAIVLTGYAEHIMGYLRTDFHGRAIETPREITTYCWPEPCHWGSFNVTWARDGFGVIALGDVRAWGLEGLFLFPFSASP